MLLSNAARWGNYEWRDDGTIDDGSDGAKQLAEDNGFRAAVQGFPK